MKFLSDSLFTKIFFTYSIKCDVIYTILFKDNEKNNINL